MSNYNERLIKAITYQSPDEIPVNCNFLPGAWMKYGDKMADLAKEYPDFIHHIPDYKNPENLISGGYRVGSFTDEWGCVWENLDEGIVGMVTKHPIPNREDILTYKPPNNTDGNCPHGFMYLRLLDLRGFEEAMIDFAEECDEIQVLIDMVADYNCRQVMHNLPGYKKGQVVIFGDDLGMQEGLAIGADKWRKYLKPAFTRIYAPLKEKGCLVYMHTDGRIIDIMPDIVECGVDIINPQFRANGLNDLVRVCKGKIPIELDLDRQMFPFATPDEIHNHVQECVEALYLPEGGLSLNIEIGYDVPLTNMVAIFDAVRKFRKYKG